MTTELATREQGGAMTFRQATDAASLCKAIVTETAVKIGGRRYVRVEGWQAIAVAHGCVASAGGVERIQGGVRAIGEVKRASDGMVLSSAEGFVGDDEATWGKREEYAKRAMAQTRAISRACRSAFAHVVVLMNAGLETTPAEEVPSGGFIDTEARETPPNARKSAQEAKHGSPPPAAPRPPAEPPKAGRDGYQKKEGCISEKQAKRLWAIAKHANVGETELHDYLKAAHGVEHFNEIGWRSYEEICAWAEAGGKAVPPDAGGFGDAAEPKETVQPELTGQPF